MPKRTDIKKILVIGSGPIVISQGCEFDYSGTQACKALKEEGYTVILVNSNPATIMTDPEFAHRTYIEPITAEVIEKIIEKEKPDVLLPTLGGQTGLNVSIELFEKGILKKYNVEMIGANADAIKRAEDRELFKETMKKIGLAVPKSGFAHSMNEAYDVVKDIGYPVVIRPSFTLGGTGGGIAYNIEEFENIAEKGLESSMTCEILIEESVIGWKEYELEVMRDKRDNVVIICSIENFDPMGVHTGDSITVAPAQTLTDKEYQRMRDAAIEIIRAIGVETGGSNIQFAINPSNGYIVAIEMNPRVSRSSALASKATGFPIAKIAAKLAVGYTLDELPNDITKKTPACFEPAIDYCVVKLPRFAFEKFPDANPYLTTQMKSVGETMAIGRTFKEALQKGIRGLEVGKTGLAAEGEPRHRRDGARLDDIERSREDIVEKLRLPNAERIFYLKYAIKAGLSLDEIHQLTKIDKWFLSQVNEIIEVEDGLKSAGDADLLTAKQHGFSDTQLAKILNTDEPNIRKMRKDLGIVPAYNLVDTCAAEFEAYTPYYYSTYEKPFKVREFRSLESLGVKEFENSQNSLNSITQELKKYPSPKKKIMILGGGPNRIGQGIEFDYCCVHASFALNELGYETIMVNSNPETVSTDYDTSDKLYFEPVTLEDVLNIVDRESPDGVIVQFGGQTPLNLAVGLESAGVKIIGTPVEKIDIAEDREKFSLLIERLKLTQAPNGVSATIEGAIDIANRIGYPVLVRPSYVLGGRAMEIIYDEEGLRKYMRSSKIEVSRKYPILVDKFLDEAIEVDVDLVGDGKDFVIGGILEHIEEAGIHSGDSAMVLPPYTLGDDTIEKIREITYLLANELKIVGLMNIQFAVKDDAVYILEVNPRASRTIPFISKAIGVPIAKLASKAMVGVSLKAQGFTKELVPDYVCVKESVFPFTRFQGVDIILGPEMKSTGEVMGIDKEFGQAFIKSQLGAGQMLPKEGTVFISVKNKDKRSILLIAKRLQDIGFNIIATAGTAKALIKNGIKAQPICKIHEGRPNILDMIKNGKINLVINTPSGKVTRADEVKIRSLAVCRGIPCITTISGAQASVNGIEAIKKEGLTVKCLQDYYI